MAQEFPMRSSRFYLKLFLCVCLILGFAVALAVTPPSSSADPTVTGPTTSNDQYFSQQWALNNDGSQTIMIEFDGSTGMHTNPQAAVAGVDIGWLPAQPEVATLAINPVTVAVIDSGIDPKHPDLQGRISTDGYDFLNATANLSDDMGHGTHVSGIIAANAGNGVGIAGIAPPAVTVLPLRILSNNYNNFLYNNRLISDYAADAINYAVAHHASIINMSLGWPKLVDTANAQNAVKNALQAGVMVIVAAGNDHKDQATYPCAYEGVICVGSVSNNGTTSVFSNFGGQIDILAPGDSIVSTYPTGLESANLRITGYEMLSGTSQASPMVAAVAATLKSVNPKITNSEIEARLLLSTQTPVSANAGLYGMVNLKRALDAQPQSVFMPDFKGTNEFLVNEKSLTIQATTTVTNLWKTATQVRIQATVNGQSAGSAQVPSLAQGASLPVPWTYHFNTLDDASEIPLTLTVTDAEGDSKTFTVSISAFRSINQMTTLDATNQKVVTAPGVPTAAWIDLNLGQFSTNLKTVNSYGESTGLTRYFKQENSAATGSLLTIFDPANTTNPLSQTTIPYMQNIYQVSRMDVNQTGTMDWVVEGTGTDAAKNSYLYFYFMNPQFQPLSGTQAQSTWSFLVDQTLSTWQLPLRLYTSPGSWVKLSATNPTLYPSFIAPGPLPAGDGFDALDPRHYATTISHFYYLTPGTAATGQPIPLTLHALDNAQFETANPTYNIKSIIPPSDADQKAGHLRLFIQNGTDLSATMLFWDIPSIAEAKVLPATGWDVLSANGQAIRAISGNETNSIAYLNFFDVQRGSLAWSDPQGNFLDRSEFSFAEAENLINGLVAVFDLPNLGRYWFIQSSFDLVGYHQGSGTGQGAITSQQISIERDSSFPAQPFSEMFSPAVVGSDANPLPGVYIDSTLVRGDRVAVAVWNPTSNSMYKPLRYSLQVPQGCVEMPPVQATGQIESFTVPFLCSAGTGVAYVMINPAK
jgi:cell wall-associated protease